MKRVLVAIAIGLAISVLMIAFNKTVARSATRSVINVTCKAQTMRHKWGFWPGTQYVTDHTHWCYGLKPVAGRPHVYTKVITSITHVITQSAPEVSGLCDLKGTKHWNLSGSLGAYSIKWEDEGDFWCPTNLPYVNVNRYDKMVIWVDAAGQYCGANYCPCATKKTCGK